MTEYKAMVRAHLLLHTNSNKVILQIKGSTGNAWTHILAKAHAQNGLPPPPHTHLHRTQSTQYHTHRSCLCTKHGTIHNNTGGGIVACLHSVDESSFTYHTFTYHTTQPAATTTGIHSDCTSHNLVQWLAALHSTAQRPPQGTHASECTCTPKPYARR
jgi:hypothetical protein